MPTHSTAFHELRQALTALYDEREAAAIAHEVLFHITGLDRTRRLMQKDAPLSPQQSAQLSLFTSQLLGGKPLQQLLGTAWFMGRQFVVNEHVLIPRPETEELVQWILDDLQQSPEPRRILDVGSGSGCIPISLSLTRPQDLVFSCDLSAGALNVARTNAQNLGARVTFSQADFLDAAAREALGSFDIIVSNPPYIPESEAGSMHTNVRDFEPAMALFVPNADPLLFYRALAAYGQQHLNAGGSIYCELHRDYAADTARMFEAAGYARTELRRDMHGNPRMLRARKQA